MAGDSLTLQAEFQGGWGRVGGGSDGGAAVARLALSAPKLRSQRKFGLQNVS